MWELKSEGRSHIGRRKNNEDAYGISSGCELFLVADGMGGYEGGEIASGTAVEVIRRFFEDNLGDEAMTWPFGIDRELSHGENMVSCAVRLANAAILAKRHGKLNQMGTTVVVLYRERDHLILGHVGDSRIYRYREGELAQLTHDHSLYNELLAAGCLGEGDDVTAPQDFHHRNVVTRALGFPSGEDRPTMQRITPKAGDVYLLCTDGLHDVVEEQEIKQVLESRELGVACQELVERAYILGGSDNITAVLVKVEESDASA